MYNGAYRLTIRDLSDVYIYNTIYKESFNGEPTDWIKQNVAGAESWVFSGSMSINGWGNNSGTANEDWLISPNIDLSKSNNPTLTFSNLRRFFDSEPKPMSVLITANYTGNASTTAWTELTSAIFDQNTFPVVTNWKTSGEISLADFNNQQNVRIAFRYKSSGNGKNTSTQWYIDTVHIYEN